MSLPAIKGSRMHVYLELAAAVSRNRPYYLTYLSELRVEANPNKLV